MKATIHEIKYDLHVLFNYILKKGKYPSSWGEGLRVTIPKGQNDIRSITIETLLPKIFESILDARLNLFNDTFNKSDRYNGGFSKGSRTEDNLFLITACIQKQLLMGKNTFIAFVDFKKAFNFVNHNILIFKLLQHGLSGRFVKVIKDMYAKTQGVVKVNNK